MVVVQLIRYLNPLKALHLLCHSQLLVINMIYVIQLVGIQNQDHAVIAFR